MQIIDFNVSPDRSKLNITITTNNSVSSLFLWNELTYKDYSKAIDLSSYLTGDFTEVIELSLLDLGYEYFSGLYFIEATDNTEIANSVTAELTRYKECILNNLIKHSVCEECLLEKTISLVNAQGLLLGLQDAADLGFIDEMLIIVDALNLYCSEECKTCGNHKNLLNGAYYSTNTNP